MDVERPPQAGSILGVKNILLIEDEAWTRDSLALYFRMEGCRVQSATSANEAIAPLAGDRFDVILCEQALPDMDGLSLLRLYGDHQRDAVKFLITTDPPRLLIAEARRYGIHDVIQKPFAVESLERLLMQSPPQSVDEDRQTAD